ncbi:forespore regulator of the sigma-K checkpoint [Evansella vedderi]|uniref:Forespore regulator of the sigma-K checkpoint n=1 Tax=Evansella vedderi TaxID=38282 RepID=A0ABT9ZSN0_9BACI|nr:intercompartmental signaling factor BofC [Evansella vedderi]MDQ0254241.1 forespore regulator of the sigma-K checkpoint [Evansella vedderi]
MCLSYAPSKVLRKETTVFIITSIILLIFTFGYGNTSAEEFQIAQASDVKTVEVILQRHYLDGEISEETVQETIWSMEDFWAFYEEWQLVDQSNDQVIFKRNMNDISPLLKMNGYFGISDDGTLNIYYGKPQENEVIQSFFQVNTSRLKSHIHRSLMEGIPVTTKDNYLQVLKMFEEYAINEL